jgi:hypothetical protein
VAAPVLLPWLSIIILFVAAIVLRHFLAANTDVSWLLTAGERVLDGQRLYIDVVETNPPMAVLAYIPGIAIARALGLPAEVVTDSLMFALIFISLAIVARILRKSSVLDGAQGRLLAPLAFAVLAILPMQAFGQREHIAIVALLPLLAVFVVRMNGQAPPIPMAVVAGGAGLTRCRILRRFAQSADCHLLDREQPLRQKTDRSSDCFVYAAGIVAFFRSSPHHPLVRDVYIPSVCHSRRSWKNPPCRSGVWRSLRQLP